MTRPPVDTVQYAGHRAPNWYARVLWEDGSTLHGEPWMTQKVAEYDADYQRKKLVYMARREDLGDGDTCPLFPEHGNMYHLRGSDPPMQWCPDSAHSPSMLAVRDGAPPPSRSKWPLYGFEESVQTYMARLDREIKNGGVTLGS